MGGKRITEDEKSRRNKIRRAAYYAANKEKAIADAAKWNRENKVKRNAQQKISRSQLSQVRKEEIRAINKEWRDKNRDRIALNTKSYVEKNRDRKRASVRHNNVQRRSRLGAQAIARKYSNEIREIYLACPKGFHVDHIIPIRGKLVTGLHVPWNMQYLPARENISKGNKVE